MKEWQNICILSIPDVEKLKRLRTETKLSYKNLGQRFGISKINAKNICQGTWHRVSLLKRIIRRLQKSFILLNIIVCKFSLLLS